MHSRENFEDKNYEEWKEHFGVLADVEEEKEKNELRHEGEQIYYEKFVKNFDAVLDYEFESEDGEETIVLKKIWEKYSDKFSPEVFSNLSEEKQTELQKEFVLELVSQISKISNDKWSIDFEKTIKTGKMNCSGCTALVGLILGNAGFKNVEHGTPAGHAINIVTLANNKTYYVDAWGGGVFEELKLGDDTQIEHKEEENIKGVKVYKINKPEIFYKIVPVLPQKEGAIASYLENLNAAYNRKENDFSPDFKEVYSSEEIEEIKREYPRLDRIKNLFGGDRSRYCGTQEFQEEEKRFENTVFIEEILNHPLVKKGLEVYRRFAEVYYFKPEEGTSEESAEQKRKLIKERADEIFGEDGIYQGILKDGKFLESREFKKNVAERLEKDFKKEDIEKLKKAKNESNDEFNKALEENLVNRQIERNKEDAEKKGEIFERIGDMYVGIVGDECRLHLPRISEDLQELDGKIKESMARLNELLQTDDRFKGVKRITGMSWVLGNKALAKRFDKIVQMNPYTEDEIGEMTKEEYEGMQKNGIKLSANLLKKYLLAGDKPPIGGRWIEKDEFIEIMKKQVREK